jgi:hypothetical protein
MPFTTAKQWRDMRDRVAVRDVEIERLVRDYFANKKLTATPEGQSGDPIYSETPLTNQEKNQIFQRVATLCNANADDYAAAVAP